MSAKNELWTSNDLMKIYEELVKIGHIDFDFDLQEYHPNQSMVRTSENVRCPDCIGSKSGEPLRMIRLFYYLTPGVIPTSWFSCCNCGKWIFNENTGKFYGLEEITN